MLEINIYLEQIKDASQRSAMLRNVFAYDQNRERLEEIQRELELPTIWDNPERAQELSKERVKLEKILTTLDNVQQGLNDCEELIKITAAEDDEKGLAQLLDDLQQVMQRLEQLEFERMFSGKFDANNAFLDIQSGSGGTEAQDWAQMLMRMYLRWGDQHGFKTEVIDIADGEVAGIKGCTIKFTGDYAYGWLRTETGVHRLVRKSPFDSNNKRHTSFASVFISPEVDDDIEIEINPADLRIDTFRASGAGGQHVNRTDSAIRITHLPTNTVVQCQNDRSQHKNKAQAMSQLKAKLYELEMQKKNEEKAAVEATKSDITWGSQIRSYVLDDGRIKDLRTGVETGNTQAVLDGDLDRFIEACLKMQQEK